MNQGVGSLPRCGSCRLTVTREDQSVLAVGERLRIDSNEWMAWGLARGVLVAARGREHQLTFAWGRRRSLSVPSSVRSIVHWSPR